MYLGSIVCLLMASVAGSAARSRMRSCGSSNMMTCLAPSLQFVSSSDFLQLMTVKDVTEITRSQVIGVCRMARAAMGCSMNMLKCILPATETPDTVEILAGTGKLLKACDRPDFYGKFRIVTRCSKRMNQTALSRQTSSKIHGCYNAYMRETMSVFKPKNNSLSRFEGNLAMLQRRDLVRNMCCSMQSYETCVGTKIADMCGHEAQRIASSINKAVYEVFHCNGSRSENCPVPAPPTAEDEASTFDFTDLFTTGVGGFGGMGNLGSSSQFQGQLGMPSRIVPPLWSTSIP